MSLVTKDEVSESLLEMESFVSSAIFFLALFCLSSVASSLPAVGQRQVMAHV